MSKLLRDNAFALSLGGCCLALSGWLYLNEAPSANSSVAAAPQATEPERAPSPAGRRALAVAAQDPARAAAKKDGAVLNANPSENAAATQLDGLGLAPADWRLSH